MEIKKTGFYELHKKHNAKVVEFAGYYMPIQYRGIIEEHKRVRSTVGLFDVSHMGEFIVKGQDAEQFLQNLTINDVSKLQTDQVQYSAMCYEDGGIVDDLLVYKFTDHYMLIVNAANLQKDWDWAKAHAPAGVTLENISDDYSLLALQGPRAEDTLKKLTNIPLSAIKYYWHSAGKVDGVDMLISRTGYTGEPGFELCFDKKYSEQVWNALMNAGKEFDIEPIGLGARDTLRLEMKYCLYGNDIDATTNPLEAGLGWITKLNKGDFIGRNAIVAAKEKGLVRHLIGFALQDRAFPRHNYKIFKDDREIGHVTSGTFSPMLEKGIGMGYVETNCSAVGSEIAIEIRNHKVPAVVVETPFYKH